MDTRNTQNISIEHRHKFKTISVIDKIYNLDGCDFSIPNLEYFYFIFSERQMKKKNTISMEMIKSKK